MVGGRLRALGGPAMHAARVALRLAGPTLRAIATPSRPTRVPTQDLPRAAMVWAMGENYGNILYIIG